MSRLILGVMSYHKKKNVVLTISVSVCGSAVTVSLTARISTSIIAPIKIRLSLIPHVKCDIPRGRHNRVLNNSIRLNTSHLFEWSQTNCILFQQNISVAFFEESHVHIKRDSFVSYDKYVFYKNFSASTIEESVPKNLARPHALAGFLEANRSQSWEMVKVLYFSLEYLLTRILTRKVNRKLAHGFSRSISRYRFRPLFLSLLAFLTTFHRAAP